MLGISAAPKSHNEKGSRLSKSQFQKTRDEALSLRANLSIVYKDSTDKPGCPNQIETPSPMSLLLFHSFANPKTRVGLNTCFKAKKSK